MYNIGKQLSENRIDRIFNTEFESEIVPFDKNIIYKWIIPWIIIVFLKESLGKFQELEICK